MKNKIFEENFQLYFNRLYQLDELIPLELRILLNVLEFNNQYRREFDDIVFLLSD